MISFPSRWHRHLPGLILAFLFLPAGAHAAVLINEVAWMGTTVSANAEWIELANTDASQVDLTGWHLVSSSGSPSITLSGSIAGNGYFLLERTDDSTVPAVTADQIYTGSLTNSGATLTLSDAGGVVIDSVVGGTNWSAIGGDNTTKDTPQRTSSGWVTAAATPRAATAGAASSGSSGSAASSTTATAGGGTATYTPPPSAISIDAGPDVRALAEVPILFSATVRTKGGAVDQAARIWWSFGDGSTAEGSSVAKTYRYTGTYLVSVKAADETAVARDELLVSVEKAKVHIASITGEGITIANDSPDRLDLSGWRLQEGGGFFRFPEGTLILPNASAFFPADITNLIFADTATLTFPDGIIASQYAPQPPPLVQPAAAAAGSYVVQTAAPEPEPARAVITEPSHDIQTVDAPAAAFETPAAGADLSEAAAAPVASGTLSGLIHSSWAVGFLGIVAVAGGVLMIL